MTGDTSFWYLVSFAIFVGFVGKPVWRMIRDGLISKQNAIRLELDEASRLKDEAIEMLRDVKAKQQESAARAQKILDRANIEARRIQDDAMEEIDQFFKSQERQFYERLSAAEKSAVLDVNDRIVTMAVEISKEVVKYRMDKELDSKVIDNAVGDLKKRLSA